jgi:hypothetical protein
MSTYFTVSMEYYADPQPKPVDGTFDIFLKPTFRTSIFRAENKGGLAMLLAVF